MNLNNFENYHLFRVEAFSPDLERWGGFYEIAFREGILRDLNLGYWYPPPPELEVFKIGEYLSRPPARYFFTKKGFALFLEKDWPCVKEFQESCRAYTCKPSDFVKVGVRILMFDEYQCLVSYPSQELQTSTFSKEIEIKEIEI